jgi:hypothetical protein
MPIPGPHRRSRIEWLTALISAAQSVESESIEEVRLTMRSALKIGLVRKRLLTETGKLTYSSCVSPVMARRQVVKLLREQKLIESKSGTDPTSQKKPTGQSSTH